MLGVLNIEHVLIIQIDIEFTEVKDDMVKQSLQGSGFDASQPLP